MSMLNFAAGKSVKWLYHTGLKGFDILKIIHPLLLMQVILVNVQ